MSRLDKVKAKSPGPRHGEEETLSKDQASAIVAEYEEWLSAPSGDWVPTREQIQRIVLLADAYYGTSVSDGTYAFENLTQDILTVMDPELAVLNDEQLQELLEYGENSKWHGLTASGFKAWKQWRQPLGNPRST